MQRSLFIVAVALFFSATTADLQAQILEDLEALLPKLPAWLALSDSTSPDSLAASYRLDFALPDAPAFDLLGGDPATIMRPSSVREFAVDVSGFVDTVDGGLTIPKAFAMEFSPGLLIGGKNLALSDYQDAPFLYRLRVSVGTSRLQGASAPSDLAVGIRTSFIDESDLRTDEELLNDVTNVTKAVLAIATNAVAPPPIDPSSSTGTGADVVTLTPAQQGQVDSLNALLTARIQRAQADLRWNRRGLDVAAAILFTSRDSSFDGMKTGELAGWGTWAEGIGTWGQWLLGAKAGAVRDSITDKLDFSGAISTRLYLGTNDYKAFVEIEGNVRGENETLLIDGGGEAMLRSGIWASFTAGTKRDLTAGRWEPSGSFTVKVGLPFLE